LNSCLCREIKVSIFWYKSWKISAAQVTVRLYVNCSKGFVNSIWNSSSSRNFKV